MTDEQILKKAIKKSVKNGWKDGIYWQEKLDEWNSINQIANADIYLMLFQHDFAKAFWEDKEISSCCTSPTYRPDKGYMDYCTECDEMIVEGSYEAPAWQLHLTRMVLEAEPIKYLEKFL